MSKRASILGLIYLLLVVVLPVLHVSMDFSAARDKPSPCACDHSASPESAPAKQGHDHAAHCTICKIFCTQYVQLLVEDALVLCECVELLPVDNLSSCSLDQLFYYRSRAPPVKSV